jgi:hypothetical protein
MPMPAAAAAVLAVRFTVIVLPYFSPDPPASDVAAGMADHMHNPADR